MAKSSKQTPRSDSELAELAGVSLKFWLEEKDFNRAVTDTLQRAGDTLVEAREVTHLFLGDLRQLEQVGNELAGIGQIRIVDAAKSSDADSLSENGRSQLYFVESSSCELDVISMRTIDCRYLARDFGVEYDGWETVVVRPQNSADPNVQA